jgi:hypothetical protein
MEYFCQLKNLNEIQDNELLRLIKVKTQEFIIKNQEYILYSFSLKQQRNKTDDQIYLNNPSLYEILPRSCSILCKIHTIHTVKVNKVIGCLEGIIKFTGDLLSEDDCIDNNNNEISKRMISFTKIREWEKDNELEVMITEKANGKFCLFTLVKDPDSGNVLVLGGSKNNHVLVSLDDLLGNKIGDKMDNYGPLIPSIFNSIYNVLVVSIDNVKLHDTLLSGYSLTGELCDGKHFTQGDNNVKWFGIFKDGKTSNPFENLVFLKNSCLNVVNYKKLTITKDSLIDEAIISSKISNDIEGLVLYCKNVVTGDCILLKSKSTNYIVKRFIRQIIQKGYDKLYLLQKRFVDASDYHGLNTKSSIRVTKMLHFFVFWLMEKKYPTFCVSSQDSEKIYTSFYHYWNMFTKETNTDLVITRSDFGDFDKELYLKNTSLYSDRDKTVSPIVIFIQGLQGSDTEKLLESNYFKSIDSNLACFLKQDQYYGDILACKGHLYHLIQSNIYKYIFVMNDMVNYKDYLDICMNLNAKTIFFTHQLKSPLYFALSFVGIFNDTLDIKQVYNTLIKNYGSSSSHKKVF